MEKKTTAKQNAGTVPEIDEKAAGSISNWAFAWLFDLADFGEEDDGPDTKPVVSW